MQPSATNSSLDLVQNEHPQNISKVDLRPSATDDFNEEAQSDTKSFFKFYLDPIIRIPSKINNSFKTKIDEAKTNTDSQAGFLAQMTKWVSGTLVWGLCLLATILIPVVLVIVGLLNLDNCPARPSLPYMVFVTGFLVTFINTFNLAMSLDLPVLTNHNILTSDLKNIIASLLNIIFNCVVFCLYITTATLVLTTHPNQNTLSDTKCPNCTNSTQEFKRTPNCGERFFGFVYFFITISLTITVLVAVVSIIAYALKIYKLAIQRGSTPQHQTTP